MPHLDVAGAVIYYETGGAISKPALLLVHADIATLRMWDCIVADLETDHFVIRPDLRGFGETRSEDVEFSDRQDLLDLLDHLGISRAVVVGASRGGMTALDLALESPDRVAGLVLVATVPSGHPPVDADDRETRSEALGESAADRQDWVAVTEHAVRTWAIGAHREETEVDPEFAQLAYALNRANAARMQEEPVAIPLNPPAFDRLDEVSVATLIAVGDADLTVVHVASDNLRKGIPLAELLRIERSAHLPSVERPAEFVGALRTWLERHSL